MMGVDPYSFVDVDEEEYIIKAAMLRKAVELRAEEAKAIAKLTALELRNALL